MIEQYRDELVASLQGTVDESRVAEEREAVASELLNILHRSGNFPAEFGSLANRGAPSAFLYSPLLRMAHLW